MRISVLIAFAACACERPASGQATESLGSLSGSIAFRDAGHDPDGTHHEATTPGALTGVVTLTILARAGVGDACPDAGANTVRARYRGTFASDGAGGYRAPLYPSGVTTASGCPVARPDMHGVIDAIVAAEIAATPATCARYCGGAARAEAIDRCNATGAPATCAGPVAAGAAGACEARCAAATAIAGRGRVADGTMQAYDGDDLEVGRLGDVRARIVLDHLVESPGSAADVPHRPL